MNQIRGRTMRQDPERPLKVANNWDVLCLSSVGDRADLQRLEATMQDRGYGDADIDNVFHLNWLRFFRAVMPA